MPIISCFSSGTSKDIKSFDNVAVSSSSWSASTDTSYPYEATITLSGVDATYFPIVIFSSNDQNLYHFSDTAVCGTDAITIYAKTAPSSSITITSITCYETEYTNVLGTLEEISWDVISKVSQEGIASNFWSIGDTKSVTINGNIGSQAYNMTLYVYIIGINHGGVNGITFQGFKNADGKNLCLRHSTTGTSTNGSLLFNMNHWGGYNYGGWKGCDLRYDILGSTNVEPSDYGAAAASGSRVGYDATSTAATNPIVNTLMSALPSELRATMRPMIVYTDNVSTVSHNTQAGVTTSVDYLPLLAEFEIFGERTNANQYEQNYQTQYEYYANGGSKVKYNALSPTSTVNWWTRSPVHNFGNYFCYVGDSGAAGYNLASYSFGVAPMFLI